MAQYEHEVSELQDLASRLAGLSVEFKDLDDRMEGFEDAVGHRDVADALHSFATNWSDKRDKLVEELQQLAGYVQIAADTYAGVENDLTGQFTMPPASGAPDPSAMAPR